MACRCGTVGSDSPALERTALTCRDRTPPGGTTGDTKTLSRRPRHGFQRGSHDLLHDRFTGACSAGGHCRPGLGRRRRHTRRAASPLQRVSGRDRVGRSRRAADHEPSRRAMELPVVPRCRADPCRQACIDRQADCVAGASFQLETVRGRRGDRELVSPQLQGFDRPQMRTRRKGRRNQMVEDIAMNIPRRTPRAKS